MSQPLYRIYNFINKHCDLEELKSLCFRLGVKYEDLLGESKKAKAQKLVEFLDRRCRVDDLPQAYQEELNVKPAELAKLKDLCDAWRASQKIPSIGIREWILSLFINFSLWMLGALILKAPVRQWVPCVKPWAGALSLSGFLLLSCHLIKRVTSATAMGQLDILIQWILALFEVLPDKIAYPLFLIALLTCMWVLGWTPFPLPCCQPDEPPIIQHFSVFYLVDETTQYLDQHHVVEIPANQRVKITVETLQQNEPICTWRALYGQIEYAQGCATFYTAPFDNVQDTLTVAIQSPCTRLQAHDGLHIKVLKSSATP